MKIPLRSIPLEAGFNETLTNFHHEDYEFLFILWSGGVLLPLISLIIKLALPGWSYAVASNLCYHFAVCALFGLLYKALSHTCTANANECRLSGFVLAKALILSFVGLYSFPELFSLNFEVSSGLLRARLAQAIAGLQI